MSISSFLDTAIRIMFVDDEDKIRKLLHVCIDWNSIGCIPVKDAASAHHALELIPTERPDVIITDIQMPFINGLDFAQMVMEEYPEIKIIVLTAHDLFDYAQKGVDIGVYGFLLKPVKRDELIQKMKDLREIIIEERKRLYEYETLKLQLQRNLETLAQTYLTKLLLNKVDEETLWKNLEYYHIPLHPDTEYYNILLLMPVWDDDIETGNLQHIQCHELISSIIKRLQGVILFPDIHQNLVLLCENKKINLLTYASLFSTTIQDKIGISVYASTGSPVTSLIELSNCYKVAYQAALVAKYSNDRAYLPTNVRHTALFQMHDHLQQCMEDFSMYLQIPLKDKAMEMIYLFYNVLESTKEVPFSDIIVTSLNIINTILTTLSDNHIPYHEIYLTEHLPYTHILTMKELSEIKNYMEQLTAFTLDQLEQYTSSKGNAFIGSIQKYMNDNLSDPSLSLKTLASINFVNASYLSRIFKEYTGTTFMDYLMSIRIEKAKKMLANQTLRIYEIAELVGIHDPNYFSKFFKKYTGETPASFRESIKL